MLFKSVCQSVFAITAFSITIATIASFVHFLSRQHNPNIGNGSNTMGEFQTGSSTVWALCENLIYAYFFIFQHSLMATKFVKEFLMKIGLGVVHRSIYVLCSSLALKLLVTKWRTVEMGALWIFDTSQDRTFWWTFASIQCLGWMIVFGGCIIMDWGEMLGMKQVWYSNHGLADPMNKKSKELQSLFDHMRHPSLIGFFIIFWIHPHMTLDRCILAIVFTAYMLGFFTIDKDDFSYQQCQYFRKEHYIFRR